MKTKSVSAGAVSWPHHFVWVVPVLAWLATTAFRSGRVLPQRLLLLATAAWFVLSLHQAGERVQDGAPYQWTGGGNLYVTVFGYLAVSTFALALLPVWSSRLRPPDRPAAPVPR